MNYIPDNTLAILEAMPQRKALDLSKMPLSLFAASVKEVKQAVNSGVGGTTLADPQDDAINFYLLNHCMTLVKKRFTENEVLPEWAHLITTNYRDELVRQARDMFAYLFCIITREARHMAGLKGNGEISTLGTKFGPEFQKFMEKSTGEGTTLEEFLKGKLACSVGQYVEGISYCFHKGKYGHGYGGKPWGMVADCLAAVIKGETTLEMMVDTAFTLAHNNGPIFNKGMIYNQYGADFAVVLDIQRAGQIPNLVLENELDNGKHGIAIPNKAKSIMNAVTKALPGEFRPYIDWIGVEAAGSLKKYPSHIANQKYLHPESIAAQIQGDKLYTGLEFDLWPNESVKIVKRLQSQKVGAL